MIGSETQSVLTVDRTVLVSHLALNHLTADVFSFKDTTVRKFHDTGTMLVVVLQPAFIEITISI